MYLFYHRFHNVHRFLAAHYEGILFRLQQLKLRLAARSRLRKKDRNYHNYYNYSFANELVYNTNFHELPTNYSYNINEKFVGNLWQLHV
jgi:hypothetical protein